MKYLVIIFCLSMLLSCDQSPKPTATAAQTTIIKDSNIIKKETANPYVQVDISPMDMAYFPADYPIKKMNSEVSGSPMARVIYSRPHRGGRKLFGELVKWGQPWRLGANEATEIEFFQSATIQNKRIGKGQYILYAIPYEDRWTIVFNRNLYSWGLKFNPSDDVMKVDVPVSSKDQLVEHFTMSFEPVANGAQLIMAWENKEARLPIQF
ncbi:MAG TPA: DUF2911 domain-containing protein [Flavisolibacter sp.]